MAHGVDGREQIEAGLELICWSGLVTRDANGFLIETDSDTFERAAAGRNEKYGRVLSWLVFSAGCEYLLKGACIQRGLTTPETTEVLRVPTLDADLDSWANSVLKTNSKDPTLHEKVHTTQTMGKLPLSKLLAGEPDEKRHRAAFKLLRDSIRNRDAHQYVRNVRAAHVHAVPRLFVPALNAVLRAANHQEV